MANFESGAEQVSDSSQQADAVLQDELSSESTDSVSEALSSMTESDTDVDSILGGGSDLEIVDGDSSKGSSINGLELAFAGGGQEAPPEQPDEGDGKDDNFDDSPVGRNQAQQEWSQVMQWSMREGGLFRLGRVGENDPIADGSIPGQRPDHQLTEAELDNLIKHPKANDAQKEFAKFLKDNFEEIAKLGAIGERGADKIDMGDFSRLQQAYMAHRTRAGGNGTELGRDASRTFQRVIGHIAEQQQKGGQNRTQQPPHRPGFIRR